MIHTLSDMQYAAFMARVREAPARDQCILLLLLHAGMRNGEVCNLRFQDFCYGKEVFHTINILNGHSKTNTMRYISLTPVLISALESYLLEEFESGKPADPSAHAFKTFNQGIPIQQKDIQRIVDHYTRLWLGEAFTPHSLRHTFATRLMRCSSIRVVQQLLGHRSLASTQVYTHPNSEDRSNAVHKAF